MDRPRLVIVIPAHNEAGTIASVVTSARQYGPVIVVDDASTDETVTLAAGAGATIVRNPANLGYAAALNRGLDVALAGGYSAIVTMDADGEHDPNCLSGFASAFTDAEVALVLGRRRHRQRWAEIVMCHYIRTRFGPHDILCGMKGYRADLVEASGSMAGDLIGTGLAIAALREGKIFRELPVNGARRQDATRFGGGWRANRRILQALCQVIRDDFGFRNARRRSIRGGGAGSA